jgi:hypothetical protein
VSPLPRSKKEALDTVDPQQVLIPGVDRNILTNYVTARVPLSTWLKRDEVKMKSCIRSTPLPRLQLMPQPTLQLMPRQMLQPTKLAMSPTTQLTLPTFRETLLQTQEIVQELNLF